MLHVHRASRAAALVDALAGLLAEPAPGADPFAPEVVAVPSRGIERWLAQELSLRLGVGAAGHDGVCANVAFPFPATVVHWAVEHADGGLDLRSPELPEDPWSPARLTWSLLEVVEAGEGTGVAADALGAFGAHLAADRDRVRRLSALRHVADLFDRYAVHRPAMVRAWAAGEDVDGAGDALDDDLRWQPTLWRAVRRHLGTPSFAERVGALDLGMAGVPGLPPRIAVHGLTALPASYLEVLDQVAVAHDVHLFLLHPSPAAWERVAPHVAGLPRPTRAEDPSGEVVAHPLLASWGRDSRELQVVLAGRGQDRPLPEPATGPDAAPTLLARLQQDLRADRRPPGRPVRAGEPDPRVRLHRDELGRALDRSLQVHACHGRLRQVEVLRDVVLGILDDDPTIQPRDVVVMCPDVEAFAPMVDAVFGADARVDQDAVADGAGRLPDVRVRLADRSLRQVNPLLRTVADLLALPDARVEATVVVDLARRAPVRQRFGWDDADLDVLEDWIAELGIRWGLDADHRAEHGIADATHSWQAGLDRLLVGVAVAGSGLDLVGGVLPHGDVDAGAAPLAGRLAEFVDRVAHVTRSLRAPRPLADWCDALADAVDLVADVAPEDAWQRVQLDRLLERLRRQAAEVAVPVGLVELRSLLEDELRGRPSRANHRTGDLTVCSLVPMRSVPYRVVCLLGLDDEAFPRRTTTSGDDLVARSPVVGDRDPRTEDRQLLLDAVLAAGDHLVIVHRGRDERSDEAVPPAVPVAELLDVVDATAVPADGRGRARDLVLHHHPLRAADPRCFDPAGPFGFDPVALEAARASTHPVPPRPFLDGLPAAGARPTVVDWGEFTRFFRQPVASWLQHRMGVRHHEPPAPLDDRLPVEVLALEGHGLGSRLLRAALAGRFDACRRAVRASGDLPAGGIGDHVLARLEEDVLEVAAVAREHLGDLLATPAERHELDLRIGDVHLVGVVPQVRQRITRVDYGRPKPKRLLDLWLPWAALHAAGEGRGAVMVTRGRDAKEAVCVTTLPAELDPAEARLRLARVVELFVRGHEEPLPLFAAASPAWVKARREGKDPTQAFRKAWRDRAWGREYGDGTETAIVQVLGAPTADEVLGWPATDLEQGQGWVEDGARAVRLAHRLWDPVLDDCLVEVR